MSININVRVGSDLRAAIVAYAKQHGMTLSEAIRFLLRTSLGQSTYDAGYAEGKYAAFHHTQRKIGQALNPDE